MKIIPLTQGKVAIVDDRDYRWLSQYKWHAQKSGKRPGLYYAVRNATINKRRKTIQMHREIMNPAKGLEIDHRNNNALDNRRLNMRTCTRAQNMANSRAQKGKSSAFKGVSFHKEYRKWRGRITHLGKDLHLGFFRNQVRAAKAYDDKAKELFGEFAHPNFPHQIRRRNIYRWLMATNGRLFSMTLVKSSTGIEKKIFARVGLKTRQKGKDLRYNMSDKKFIVVYDIKERTYKCILIENIEAVCCRGKRYRVD
jgi:hypothetical protein